MDIAPRIAAPTLASTSQIRSPANVQNAAAKDNALSETKSLRQSPRPPKWVATFKFELDEQDIFLLFLTCK